MSGTLNEAKGLCRGTARLLIRPVRTVIELGASGMLKAYGNVPIMTRQTVPAFGFRIRRTGGPRSRRPVRRSPDGREAFAGRVENGVLQAKMLPYAFNIPLVAMSSRRPSTSFIMPTGTDPQTISSLSLFRPCAWGETACCPVMRSN